MEVEEVKVNLLVVALVLIEAVVDVSMVVEIGTISQNVNSVESLVTLFYSVIIDLISHSLDLALLLTILPLQVNNMEEAKEVKASLQFKLWLLIRVFLNFWP